MLCAFGHPVATCCGMLLIENRTSARTLAQNDLDEPGATPRSNARNMFRPTMLRYVALKCCECLAGALNVQRYSFALFSV